MSRSLVLVLLLLLPFAAPAQCGRGSEIKVTGSEPLASSLYHAAHRLGFAWKRGTFDSEQSDFLGTIRVAGAPVHVVYLTTIWGDSCRVTNRLIFFSAKLQYLGQYYGISHPRLRGEQLVFTPGQGARTEVDLQMGLPKTIDGGDDFYTLDSEP